MLAILQWLLLGGNILRLIAVALGITEKNT